VKPQLVLRLEQPTIDVVHFSMNTKKGNVSLIPRGIIDGRTGPPKHRDSHNEDIVLYWNRLQIRLCARASHAAP